MCPTKRTFLIKSFNKALLNGGGSLIALSVFSSNLYAQPPKPEKYSLEDQGSATLSARRNFAVAGDEEEDAAASEESGDSSFSVSSEGAAGKSARAERVHQSESSLENSFSIEDNFGEEDAKTPSIRDQADDDSLNPDSSKDSDFSGIFYKQTGNKAKNLAAETYSITTTSFPLTDTPSSVELLVPSPQEVKKFNEQRKPKHQKKFQEVTGHTNAKDCLKADAPNVSMESAQIGHAQGYQNHGPSADSLNDNLAVISQPANLAMNVTDGYYADGDIDGNYHLIYSGTQVGVASVQQLLDPNDHAQTQTLPTLIASNLKREDRTDLAKEKLKKQVRRAHSPSRRTAINACFDENPKKRLSYEEQKELLRKKANQYRREGVRAQKVVKFPNESRNKRDKKDSSESTADSDDLTGYSSDSTEYSS